MKTSRIAKESAKVSHNIGTADDAPRPHTRAFAATLTAFTASSISQSNTISNSSESGATGILEASDGPSEQNPENYTEDLSTSAPPSRRRKRDHSPETAALARQASPRVATLYDGKTRNSKARTTSRQPAKRIRGKPGEIHVTAPPFWEETYRMTQEMRQEKLAPVDSESFCLFS